MASAVASADFGAADVAAGALVWPVLAHPVVQSRQSADAAVIAAARFMDRLGFQFRADNAPVWSIFP
jgi:hypothetical protein